MSERMKILKMVEDGIISSEDAMKLMDAIEQDDSSFRNQEKINVKGKKLKVKVFDPQENKKVDIKIPLSLVNLGLKIGSKFSPDFKEQIGGVDIEELIRSALEEVDGAESQTIVDIEEENGTVVKVSIE